MKTREEAVRDYWVNKLEMAEPKYVAFGAFEWFDKGHVAGAEWLESQVSEGFDDYIEKENDDLVDKFMDFSAEEAFRCVWQAARLSARKEIEEKDAEIKRLKQVCDMESLISKQYRDVFYDVLNMSNRNGKLSPNDAKILLQSTIDMLSKPTKGLDQTAPETYLKLKKQIAERDKQLQDAKDLVRELEFIIALVLFNTRSNYIDKESRELFKKLTPDYKPAISWNEFKEENKDLIKSLLGEE